MEAEVGGVVGSDKGGEGEGEGEGEGAGGGEGVGEGGYDEGRGVGGEVGEVHGVVFEGGESCKEGGMDYLFFLHLDRLAFGGDGQSLMMGMQRIEGKKRLSMQVVMSG